MRQPVEEPALIEGAPPIFKVRNFLNEVEHVLADHFKYEPGLLLNFFRPFLQEQRPIMFSIDAGIKFLEWEKEQERK